MKTKKASTKKTTKKVETPWWTPRDFVKNPICLGEK